MPSIPPGEVMPAAIPPGEPVPASPPYERELIVTVIERWDGHDHGWEATASLPNGKEITWSLSDDMPYSPGDAMASAGKMLDIYLAEAAWDAEWKKVEAK